MKTLEQARRLDALKRKPRNRQSNAVRMSEAIEDLLSDREEVYQDWLKRIGANPVTQAVVTIEVPCTDGKFQTTYVLVSAEMAAKMETGFMTNHEVMNYLDRCPKHIVIQGVTTKRSADYTGKMVRLN